MLLLFYTRKFQRKIYVCKAVPLHEKVEALEYHRDLPARFSQLRIGKHADIYTVNIDCSRAGALKHVDTPHKSAFPSSAHTNNSIDIAV